MPGACQADEVVQSVSVAGCASVDFVSGGRDCFRLDDLEDVMSWKGWLVFVAMVLVYGLVGSDDYDHQVRAEAGRAAVYVTGW